MRGKPSVFLFVLALGALFVTSCGLVSGVAVSVPVVEFAVDVPGLEVTVGTRQGLERSGQAVTETRPVANFQRVALAGVGKLLITQGEEESLTVTADESLLPYVVTSVKAGTLTLGLSPEARQLRPLGPIQFNLSVIDLAALEISGAGDVRADSLAVDRLELRISGAGDINIDSLTANELVVRLTGAGNINVAGQVAEQRIRLSGAGGYRARKLESQWATVEVSGAGAAAIWATDRLDVQISGSGNVDCYGNPAVTKQITGVGGLVHRGRL